MKLHKTIKGIHYYATEDGRVFYERYGKLKEMVQNHHRRGYNYVQQAKRIGLVHRIVAETFIPNPLNKLEVNHIDGDKKNNHVSNLEWATRSENMKHHYRNKRYKLHGSLNSQAKLTEAIVSNIKKRLLAGETGTSLATEYGVAHGRIYDIKHGRSWSHVLEAAKKAAGL